ncbi:MAG: phytoene/squalene synthase family protein [Halobacteriales archaeon]|nr:phytoene/squalene synthase family protein [Halobacteriales archaeon]
MSPPPNHLATAKAIQRRTGRTFHLATRLLPARARLPTYVLYAFFRVADEVVDDPDPVSTDAQRRELDEIRAAALGNAEPTDEVLEAFAALREAEDLDDREIEIFLDAMAMDLEQTTYETAEELGEYLRGSSVAVAYLMLQLFGDDIDDAARPHAAALAEAFQLTNFLRDVREDAVEYGRVYLPKETLRRHGVSVDDVLALRASDGVAAAVRDELEHTEALYREGVAGIRYLPDDVQFGVLLAAVLYAEHHRLIRAQGYDTLSERPRLSTARRLALAARTWFHWRTTGDAQAVFEAVSAVADAPSDTAGVRDALPTLGDPFARRPLRPARRAAGRVRAYLGAGSK